MLFWWLEGEVGRKGVGNMGVGVGWKVGWKGEVRLEVGGWKGEVGRRLEGRDWREGFGGRGLEVGRGGGG